MAKASVTRLERKIKEKRVNQVRPVIQDALKQDPDFQKRLYRARYLLLEAEVEKKPAPIVNQLRNEFEALLREKGLL